MRIYVCGPYGRRHGLSVLQIEANVEEAKRVARQVYEKGHIPVVPHLYHYLAEGWVNGPTEEQWASVGLHLLGGCQGIVLFGGCESELLDGSHRKKEMQMARPMGLEIYHSIDEIPDGR